MRRFGAMILLAALAACAADGDPEAAASGDAGEMMAQPLALGPADGHDLPSMDLERVQTGQMAPDFTLASLAGPNVTLSDFRGEKNVVLVFYRGHW